MQDPCGPERAETVPLSRTPQRLNPGPAKARRVGYVLRFPSPHHMRVLASCWVCGGAFFGRWDVPSLGKDKRVLTQPFIMIGLQSAACNAYRPAALNTRDPRPRVQVPLARRHLDFSLIPERVNSSEVF